MGHPIGIVTYHRPEHTKRTLSALRGLSPEPFYVFCDGPKDEQDAVKCRAVQEVIANTVDWTTPRIVVRHENWGLRRSIVHAADYILARHDTIILLEDDCMPGPHFYHFMSSCLDIYRDHDRILGVTGYTVPIPNILRTRHPWDVYFFPRIGSWSWGTWKEAWALYERDYADAFERAQSSHVDLTVGGRDIPNMIQYAITGRQDTWTPGWLLAAALSGRQYIYPMKSHVHNIGLDGSGVHCSATTRLDTPIAQTAPTRFPADVIENKAVYRHFRKYYP